MNPRDGLAPGHERLVQEGLRGLEGLSILVFDTDMRFWAVHGAAAARHGFDPARIVGRRAPDVLPVAAWAQVGPHYASTLAGVPVTMTAASTDGTAVYETSFAPVLRDGVVVGGTATSRDITQRHRAEMGLRRSEEDFRHLAEGSSDVLFRCTPDGRLLYASPATEHVLGRTIDALAGLEARVMLHPDDHERATAAWGQVVKEGATRAIETRVTRPDGTVVWIECELRALRRNRRTVEVHGEGRDVTHRRAVDDVHRQWELSFATMPRGVVWIDPETNCFLRINPAAVAMHGGGTPEDYIGKPMSSVMSAESSTLLPAVEEELLEHGSVRFESHHVRRDGSTFPVMSEIFSARDADGALLYRLAFLEDLSAERASDSEGRRAVELFEQSFRQAPVGMLLFRGTVVQRANAAMAELLGTTPEALVGRPPLSFVHPDDHAASVDAAERGTRGERIPPQERRVITDAGEVRNVHLRYSVLGAEHGEATVLVHVMDRTAAEEAQRELTAARDLFEAAFEEAPVGKHIVRHLADGSTEVVKGNAAFAAMIGEDPASLIGRPGNIGLHPDDEALHRRMIAELRAGHRTTEELRMRHRDGTDIWTHTASAMVESADGERLIVSQVLDISERKRFEERLQYLADHDVLTGAFSRRRFEEELGRESARVARHGGQSCLLLLDLDGFKHVNDSFGHASGDRLLTRIGKALEEALREVDVLARIGGDEFAVILTDTDLAGAQHVAGKLLEAIRTHGRILSNDTQAEVTASIGATFMSAVPRVDAGELLVEADIAMYQAKDAGKDQLAVYDRASGHRAEIVRRTDWIGRLRRAVREQRFVLHAQPIVPLLPNPGAEHFELLLRLQDDDGSLLPPDAFLRHAERHGMVVDIDRWVLGQAVGHLHRAERAGRNLSLAVNFSARTVQDQRIGADLAAMLAAQPIAPHSLMIEVTETAAITNVARAVELSQQLRELGCRLGLDDFGTGFASFYYLKHLVFDVLKIDGDFIDRLPTSATDQLVVRAVVDIARGLGARLIAERVSDQATVELLTELGVDYGQGHFLGRPGPLPAHWS